MKTKREMVEGVEKFAKSFQCVLDMAEFIKDMDVVERTCRELDGRLADKRILEAEADARLIKAEENLQASQQKLEEALKLRAQAAAGAKTEAAQIRAEAHREAERLRQAAETGAKGIVEAATAEASRLSADLAAKRADLETLSAEVDSKKRDNTALEKKIADAKAKIARMFEE